MILTLERLNFEVLADSHRKDILHFAYRSPGDAYGFEEVQERMGRKATMIENRSSFAARARSLERQAEANM